MRHGVNGEAPDAGVGREGPLKRVCEVEVGGPELFFGKGGAASVAEGGGEKPLVLGVHAGCSWSRCR